MRMTNLDLRRLSCGLSLSLLLAGLTSCHLAKAAAESDRSEILLRSRLVTVHHLLDEGLAMSPRLEAARAQLPVARAAIQQAKVLPNPGVMIDNQYHFTYKLGAIIFVEAPWVIVFRLMAAKKQVEQAQLQLADILWKFRGAVRRLYAELAMAQEMSDTQNQLLDLTKRLHGYAQYRFKNGDVPRLDVHRAELAVVQAEIETEQAQLQIGKTREQLNILIGRDSSSELRLPPMMYQAGQSDPTGLLPDVARPMYPLSELVHEALNSRLELRVTSKAVLVARDQLNVARGKIWPTAQFNIGRMIDDRVNSPFIRRDPYFQANILFPLFDRQQGERAKYHAEINRLSKELLAQRNLIIAEVAAAYRRVEMARAKIGRYQQDALRISNKITDSAELGYKLGRTDITAVLDVQQRNIVLRTQYLNAVLEYQLAINELEQAVGHPLT